MTEILVQYGLFFAKSVTVVFLAWLIIGSIVSFSHRRAAPERLEVKSLNKKYNLMAKILQMEMLPRGEFKKTLKADKAKRKAEKKRAGRETKRRIFVLDFHGDIRATEVSNLREEITAILTVATEKDEVVVRLENSGGLVHSHGLAASQLLRLRQKEVPLTISVDKVAASGGYLMACVGNRIVAAPFAVLGSIGVLAQFPNFHRLLEKSGVDFEQIKAGELKRTLTLFGKNTEAERAIVGKQLDETHQLFKALVERHRPQVDMTAVATGEHWYGVQALELKLVDELETSDDYLLSASEDADLFHVTYKKKGPMVEKVASVVRSSMERLLFST